MDPDQHHNALNQGDKLHWYEVKSILGQGGFGITYLVLDTNLGRQFAIKEYLPTEFSTRDASSTVQPISENHTEVFNWGKERFLDEARTLAQFEHPNIVRVHSFFEHFNTGYMVMEYEEGRDFSELIKNGEFFDEERLLGIILPILEGLEKVHAQGFVHRDIKPQNIFIRHDGSPVLIDFGSARQAIGGQTRTMTSLVTPGYAPFEQYHDAEGKQGPWTDIYALGATLYCAITGKPPADALKRGQARVEHNTDAYLSLVDLKGDEYSAHFLQAIDYALGFLATDRPASVDEWMQMLRGELAVPEISTAPLVIGNDAETVIAAETQPDTEPVAKTQRVDIQTAPTAPEAAPPKSSRWPMIAVALLLIVLVGVGGIVLQQSDQGETAQAELARLQAELDAKSAQLKEAELEKLQAELEEKAKQLEQAEQQRLAEEAKQAEAERKRQEQARLVEAKAVEEKLAKEKAAQEEAQAKQARAQAEKAERERKAKLAREKAEQERQAQLAREQAEKQRLAKEKAEREAQAKREAEQAKSVSAKRTALDLSGVYATEVTSKSSGYDWVFGKRTRIEVRLQQRGSTITGVFSGEKSGEIEGTLDNNKIDFKWYVTSEGSTEGKGEWLVSPDGSLIEGTWRSLQYDIGGGWSMLKVGDSGTGKLATRSDSGIQRDFSGRYSSEITFNRESSRWKKFSFGQSPEITVELIQNGDKITGTFEGSRGGDIEGRVLEEGIEFVWYITSGGNADHGTGSWQFDTDESVAQGVWEMRKGDWAGNWNLSRLGAASSIKASTSEPSETTTTLNTGTWTGTYSAVITGKHERLGLKGKKFKVQLVQDGNEITGTFGSEGQLWGSISGAKVKFGWSAGKINSGDGVWDLYADEKRLYGNWYDWNEDGSWSMTRDK